VDLKGRRFEHGRGSFADPHLQHLEFFTLAAQWRDLRLSGVTLWEMRSDLL